MNKLKIGIPDGSLIDPKRGGLKELLDKSRIYTNNLGINSKPEVTNIHWLEVIMQRPQELPYLAAQGYCDAFFCGDDWAKEWSLRGYSSKKILGLGIGKVDIVVATKCGNEKYKIVASEYPFIAKDYLQKEFMAEDVQIIRYGEPIKNRYIVIDSCGKTELKVIYELADFVVENTQSGRTLKNLDLIIWDNLFSSECSLYINDKMDDKWKLKKTKRIADMIEGALNSYGKDLVTFNVENKYLEKILDYIRVNRLFGDEETVIKGKKFSKVTLELPTNNKEKPLVDIIGNLRDRGATSIEGIPLSYSIK